MHVSGNSKTRETLTLRVFAILLQAAGISTRLLEAHPLLKFSNTDLEQLQKVLFGLRFAVELLLMGGAWPSLGSLRLRTPDTAIEPQKDSSRHLGFMHGNP